MFCFEFGNGDGNRQRAYFILKVPFLHLAHLQTFDLSSNDFSSQAFFFIK
jgi:hypothetical protein